MAGSVFEIFKRNTFDGLILGGHRNVLSEFKKHLHPYLSERLVDVFHAEPAKISVADVLKHALAIERRVEIEREHKRAEQLVRKAQAGDRAVTGVSATIE